MTTPDGLGLGTATIEDIVRTRSCSVEITVSLTTSDEAGPQRWASVGPRDFAELRPSGSIRPTTHLEPACEQASNSRTTALPQSHSYELVIAVGIGDSALRTMFQPEGTAGWIVDPPAQTTDAAEAEG
ncbi:hypothetical protein [Dietzia maris]|uniref:hypothetical protein n=1 Tax=Dietzia maris TaxID=37915 RepID=UPI0037C72918